MPKVLRDEKLINKFLERGVENIYPSKEFLYKKLISGERLRAYQGFDPTGSYLHVGHAMGIRALRILQKLGHEVIFLVGDFTARIGDPDKKITRDLLSKEEIKKNMAGWKKQASQLIDFEDKDNPVKFVGNYEWLSKMNFREVLELMSHATVQRMLERDLFDRRIKRGDPIRLHEMVYPFMQGYDGVAMNVDIEIGGADQTFNMLFGRGLVKSYLGKEKIVRTHKMMEAPEGRTMSKTRGNGINLADSAEEMYGKAMSYPDDLIVKALELLTEVSMQKIKEIERRIKDGENPMDLKKMMAFETVKVIKGEDKAIEAQREWERVFQEGKRPRKMEKVKIEAVSIDTLVKIEAASSKSQAKRLIEQRGVSINSEKINDWRKESKVRKGDVIQVGPKKFFEVV